jgi:hypothetical protein
VLMTSRAEVIDELAVSWLVAIAPAASGDPHTPSCRPFGFYEGSCGEIVSW